MSPAFGVRMSSWDDATFVSALPSYFASGCESSHLASQREGRCLTDRCGPRTGRVPFMPKPAFMLLGGHQNCPSARSSPPASSPLGACVHACTVRNIPATTYGHVAAIRSPGTTHGLPGPTNAEVVPNHSQPHALGFPDEGLRLCRDRDVGARAPGPGRSLRCGAHIYAFACPHGHVGPGPADARSHRIRT